MDNLTSRHGQADFKAWRQRFPLSLAENLTAKLDKNITVSPIGDSFVQIRCTLS